MSEKPTLEQPSLSTETLETGLSFELPKPVVIEHPDGKKQQSLLPDSLMVV